MKINESPETGMLASSYKGPTPVESIGTDPRSEEVRSEDTAEITDCQPSDGLRLIEFAEKAPIPLNPGDLTEFALTETFGETAAKKALITVPVRKPSREAFVRTHPDPERWKPFSLVELKEVGKIYLLSPSVGETLLEMGETVLIRAQLVQSIDRKGNVFFWPLRLSDRESTWHSSAQRAAELAKNRWVRVQANMAAGAYDAFVAENQEVSPVWPEESYSDLLKLAFEGKVITTMDHPVLLELRGRF